MQCCCGKYQLEDGEAIIVNENVHEPLGPKGNLCGPTYHAEIRDLRAEVETLRQEVVKYGELRLSAAERANAAEARADRLQKEVERLERERADLIAAKEVNFIPPAVPESEVISALQGTIRQMNEDMARFRQDRSEIVDKYEGRYFSEKARADRLEEEVERLERERERGEERERAEDWRTKLWSYLKGAEIENIDKLMGQPPSVFLALGQLVARSIKNVEARADRLQKEVEGARAVVQAAKGLIPWWQKFVDAEGKHERNGQYLWNLRNFYDLADAVRELNVVCPEAFEKGDR